MLMDLGQLTLPGNPAPETDPKKETAEKWNNFLEGQLTEQLMSPLRDQYMPSTYGTRDQRTMRASEMGHLALEIAHKHFVGNSTPPNEKQCLFFWLGHAFEAWLTFLYERSTNCHITTQQAQHVWHNIQGHSDFIIQDGEGQQFIADAKAINGRAFNKYKRYGLLDDRGYATQLSIYSASYDNMPACIIMLNKENGDISHAWLGEEQREKCLERAAKVYDTITSVGGFDECFAYFRPPIPRAEVYQKEYTGRMLVPESMAWSELRDVIFHTYTDINARKEEKVYVSDYRYPEGYEQYKPDINEDVFG